MLIGHTNRKPLLQKPAKGWHARICRIIKGWQEREEAEFSDLSPPPPWHSLEGVLQSKLNGASFTSREDPAKCRRSESRGRVAKVGLIQEIEKFRAELQIMSFVQSEVLVHPKIHIVQPWTDQAIPANVSKGAKRIRNKGSPIEVLGNQVASTPARWQLCFFDLIRAVLPCCSKRIIHSRYDVEGRPAS